MKRYRLLKDLPTFKAGEEFALSKWGGLWKIEGYNERGEWFSEVCAYSHRTLENFPNILTDWFEEIPEEPKTVDDLEEGDECWMLDTDLEPLRIEWRGTPYDIRLRELGLIYLTKKELEHELARRKAKVILERDTKGFKPDWEQFRIDKYNVYYDFEAEKLKTSCWGRHDYGTIVFATEEDAEASIKAHPDEWKMYLGVEE